MNNQEIFTDSQTTTDSTGGSSTDSTGGSSNRRFDHPMPRWTLEEISLIQKPDIRDAFFLASRHGTIQDFMKQYFPNRTKPAVLQKIWQIEKKNAEFCKTCGSKLK